MRSYRTGITAPTHMELSADSEDILVYDTQTQTHSARAKLLVNPDMPAPFQLGRAAVHMANHAGPEVEELTITPTVMGLQGPSVRLVRRDFEQAMAHNLGSPEEIWQNTEFDTVEKDAFKKLSRLRESSYGLKTLHLYLDNKLSLAEEDSGTLYRTSLLAKIRAPRFFGIIDTGVGWRLNIKDNLNRIRDIRPASWLPVRSDEDLFARRMVGLEESYLALTHSFRPDLHMSLVGGYLEEMYAGVGGEVLYRPFGSRFAIGAEAWQVFKRDPLTDLNLGLNGDHLLTGHVNLWYDLPLYDVTLQARAGRFLAEDIGGTLALSKQFDNGAALEGFVTLTDSADFDLFGGTTHAYHGIKFTLPLSGFKFMPDRSYARFEFSPVGRDIGQALKTPLPLYKVTEPFSYKHMEQNWRHVVHRDDTTEQTKKEPPEGG